MIRVRFAVDPLTIRSRSVIARGRDRWMCEGIDELIMQGNDMARSTNGNMEIGETVHYIKKPAFDPNAFDLESDVEEEDDDE